MSDRRPQPHATPRPRAKSRAKRTPPRYNAVVASATILNARPPGLRAKVAKTDQWQEEAWRHYDENGELRFGVGWISNGLSQVNLVAAREPEALGDEPEPLAGDGQLEQDAVDLVAAIAGGPDGQAQLLARLGVLLTVPGIGYVLIESTGGRGKQPDESWEWRALSADEISDERGVYMIEDEETGDKRPIRDAHILIKVWRSHARHASKPDSSTRGALRPLRQLDMIDDHIDATAQSRLAGAGLLVLPNETEFSPVKNTVDPDDPDADDEPSTLADDFTEVLVEGMTTPIGDRGAASAVVPLVATMPGEYVDKVRHITFWSEFSETILGLGERAIKRLSLALDMPPEIITGVSGMNHWGAWRVQEEAITLHIEPLSKVIGHALTKGYFRPGLLAAGHAAEEVNRLLIGHDATNLTVRPDLSDDTIALWDRMEVASSVMRREVGLDETDKPDDDEYRRRVILRVIDRSPQLAPFLLPELDIGIEAFAGAEGQPFPITPVETTPQRQIGGPPDDSDERGVDAESSGEPEPVAASVNGDRRLSADRADVLLAACDGIVTRALERAGAKLRNKAGKHDGGAASVECNDPAELHTVLDVSTFSNVHELLDGAWTRVPDIAHRYEVNTTQLLAHLNSYTRGLLVNGQSHNIERLRDALVPHVAAVG